MPSAGLDGFSAGADNVEQEYQRQRRPPHDSVFRAPTDESLLHPEPME